MKNIYPEPSILIGVTLFILTGLGQTNLYIQIIPDRHMGKQVVYDIKDKKYQGVSMIAGQCKKDIIAPMVFTGTADANMLNFLLEKCLMPDLRAKGKKVIVMDNYSIHKSEKTRNIIENEGNTYILLI